MDWKFTLMFETQVQIGELASNEKGSFKIGPFGSSLKKDELVNRGIPIAGIENVLPNNFVSNFRKFITPEKFKQLADYEIKPGDIVVTTMGTIGRAAVVPENISTTIIDSHLFRMRVDQNRVYPPYLAYAINGFDGLKLQLEQMSRGAIMAGLNTTILKECYIPLPPLEEQKRISAIAQKCDRLRRTRRFTQQLSDTYLQSVFLEMFGDPSSNPMDWKTKKLKAIADKFSDGPFGSNLKTEHYTEKGIRVIRLQNVGIGNLVDTDKAYISEEHFQTIKKHTCLPGDVIVGTLGDPNLRAFILPPSISVAINKADCIQIRPNLKEVNSTYICWLLNMPQTLYLATAMILGQTRERISMGRLAELIVPVPPLSLQTKFARIVQKYEQLRNQQREADRQAEHLFQTVLHRAFRGEL